MNKFKQYILSESTFLGIVFGFTFYLTYGLSQKALNNLGLLVLSIGLSFMSPFYSRISNKIDEWLCFKTSFISSGRIGRFVFQFFFNIGLLCALSLSGVVKLDIFKQFSVVSSFAFLTTLLSQGSQYIAISFANREIGNKSLNIIFALVISTTTTALSLAGVPYIKTIFLVASSVIGGLVFLLGFFSDLRSRLYPKKGIAIFMGTFNPIHKTHLELIKNAIEERSISHLYIHPTVVPKLHRDALSSGEIEISKREMGMRVYGKTEKADVHVNYFPTGNRFFEFETRCLLAELAIKEANLESKVTVLKKADIYERNGFYGIINEIKKANPNVPIHGMHGSDLGGMWVRSIYDESGWIYPYSVRRLDKISATAIRNGARGQTTRLIEEILDQFRLGKSEFTINENKFSFYEGILKNENIKS